jgi:hypothetical protein
LSRAKPTGFPIAIFIGMTRLRRHRDEEFLAKALVSSSVFCSELAATAAGTWCAA